MLSNKIKKGLIVASASLLPIFASAQLQNIETNIVTPVGRIINLLIPIVFALALLYFFWGLASYILGSEHDKEVAKKRMIWGVVALFVMASIWGLVRFIGTSVGVNQDSAPPVSPLIPR